ncbi:MAG: hypothetical protein ACRC6E_02230, partial [Fusobacteriaceae bacterium]
ISDNKLRKKKKIGWTQIEIDKVSLLKEKGFGLKEIAKLMDCSTTSISKIRNGSMKVKEEENV